MEQGAMSKHLKISSEKKSIWILEQNKKVIDNWMLLT